MRWRNLLSVVVAIAIAACQVLPASAALNYGPRRSLLVSNKAAAARNLFWVGGTGNSTDATHYALTSGGTGGQNPPTAIDNVTLDGSSGGGTVTIAATFNALSLTFGAFTGTITASAKTINVGKLIGSGTGTRTFNITNSAVNVTGIGTVLDFTTITGLTFVSTGSTTTISGNGLRTVAFGAISWGTVNITGSGAVNSSNQAATFVNLTRTGTAVPTDTFTVGNFTITGTLTLTGNSQVNRLFVLTSSVGTNRTLTAAAVALTNVDFQNIIAAGAASPFTGTSLGNAQGNTSITFTGAVTRYLVAADGKNYSDITAWSASSGGATSATMPLPQDTAIADANSFASTGSAFIINVPRIGKQDWSAVTNVPTFRRALNIVVYGDYIVPYGPFGAPLVLDDGIGFVTTFAMQGGNTAHININLADVSVPGGQTVLNEGFVSNVTIASPGGTVQWTSAFLTKGSLIQTAGTLSLNGFDAQFTNLQCNVSTTRAITGTGVGERLLSSSNSVTGTPIFDFVATGLTITGNIQIETFSGSTGNRILNLAGLTFGSYHHWWHDGINNNPTITVNGGATFTGAFTVDTQEADPPAQSPPIAYPYTFAHGTTITAASFVFNGFDAGSHVTLQSDTAAQATLSAGAGANTFTFMTIHNMAFTGLATWAATSSTNSGGNSGITITP